MSFLPSCELVFDLTKSRIQHVKRHPVALFGASDRNETLVAVVLRFVDLDDTSTDLAYLVDFLSTLADDSPDHVVGDVNLLCQGRTCHGTGHWLSLWASMRLRDGVTTCLVRWHVRSCTIRGGSRLRRIVHGGIGRRLGHGAAMLRRILLGIGVRRHMVGAGIRPTSIVFTVTKVPGGRLRRVWHDLHTTGDYTGRAATSRGISRSSRTSEALVELFQESTADIVSSNMNRVRNTHHDKRAFSG